MFEDIRARVRRSVGEGLISRLLASEVAALWFATVGWRRPVPAYGGARILSYHRGTDVFHGALLGISAIEILAVHLLVSRWSMLAAASLGLLGLYGACWILADLRAARLRPISLDDEALVVRTGLRWTIRIPRDRITSIGKPDWRYRFGTEPGEVNAASTMPSKPNARSLLRTESSGSASVTWLDREGARRAAEAAARSIAERHPEIVRVVLFGSLVRGDAVPGSDADLLVVVSGSELGFVDRIAHYAPDPIGLPIDVFPYTEAEVARMSGSAHSLVRTALREGVVVAER